MPAADAYPGDAYVDYVGMDVYDASWGSDGGPISDPTARWNQIANQEYGMNWWLAFAQSHGKAGQRPRNGGLVTDTTADPNGAGDDPSFIQDMYNWMKTNQPAYETYFNYSSYDELNTTNDPNASAEYQKLWGSQAGHVNSTAAQADTSRRSHKQIEGCSEDPPGRRRRPSQPAQGARSSASPSSHGRLAFAAFRPQPRPAASQRASIRRCATATRPSVTSQQRKRLTLRRLSLLSGPRSRVHCAVRAGGW